MYSRILMSVVLGLATGLASAQEPAGAPAQAKEAAAGGLSTEIPQVTSDELRVSFSRLDSNGDSRVSPAEAKPLPELVVQFEALDVNGDSKLSFPEMAAVTTWQGRLSGPQRELLAALAAADSEQAETPDMEQGERPGDAATAMQDHRQTGKAGSGADRGPEAKSGAPRQARAGTGHAPRVGTHNGLANGDGVSQSAYEVALGQREPRESTNLPRRIGPEAETAKTVQQLSDSAISDEQVDRTFAALDHNDSGGINKIEALNLRGLADIFEAADINNDAVIDLIEFTQLASGETYAVNQAPGIDFGPVSPSFEAEVDQALAVREETDGND